MFIALLGAFIVSSVKIMPSARLRVATSSSSLMFSPAAFTRTTSSLVDHASADLWMVPKGTLDVDLGGPLDERRRYQALAIPGITIAEPYLVNFARWKRPDGGTERTR